MKIGWSIICSFPLWSAAYAANQTDILLYRQAPSRTFAWDADTANMNDLGNPSGQIIADRFSIPTTSSICRLRWWGAYGSDFAQVPEPPPSGETMRIRIFNNEDGLPGSLLNESVLLNPLRVATGFSIATGFGPAEYLYDASLDNCFSAQAGMTYWIEISQLGSQDSRWRWEGSNGAGEFAVQFPIGTPYRLITGLGQLAYELRSPEPCSGALLALGCVYILRRRHR